MIRTIKLLALAIGLAALTTPSYAAGEAMFSKGHSSWTVTGVNCTTGTAIILPTTITGYITSGVRVINQDATYAVWIGQDVNVSTKTLLGDSLTGRGEKVAAGASGVWEVGWDHTKQIRPKLYCKAADGAGTNTVPLSIAVFAYP
jgi:hypothetical protein